MDERTFAFVCFLVLMDHHGEGYIQAHPSYINEKSAMLEAGYEAFAYLDDINQNKVRVYLAHWNLPLPEQLQ